MKTIDRITGWGWDCALLLVLLGAGLTAQAQVPTWQMAAALDIVGPANVQATAYDAAGNVYVVGQFFGTVRFDSVTLTSTARNTDMFVAKWNPANGTFWWVQQAGGVESAYATSLAVSGTSVYVAGSFATPTMQLGNLTLTNAGVSDSYVAKLTDAGSTAAFEWALGVGSSANDNLGGLAVRGTGVYVAGDFSGPTATLGSRTLGNGGLGAELFVARLEDAGTSASVTWAERAGGVSADYLYCLTLHDNTALVGGFVTPLAAFGSVAVVAPLGATVPFLATLTDPLLTPARAGGLPLAFSLSPNPARAATTVHLPALPGASHATLTLLDALGRPVRCQQLALLAAGSTAQVLLAGLAPGLYQLRVVAGAYRASRAVVVE
ncbi:T9SS type A sorting domain-containing protein [Hymenobacter convexus]|uniref:T9SS type A sorting domain-containing protein n=1 Tax=Hymenobacter sp. CA1UV-4 TaxID=3063782 RepID=UPI002714490E|nr:T9SS type A sorting domain-containing protein [Hymenobacter sp. CA1UV-4]MDO7851068.1 T9SS type A sorting domain-containing protein [Hymenobacter sp. CA1UV-4]